MPTVIPPYFHSARLSQRYRDELDDALRSARLSPEECLWLQALIHPRGADDPDPVRVDRLLAASSSNRHAELAGALLLSHALTDAAPLYLYTLGLGVEVFADRASLLAALRDRYARGDGNAIFEYEKVDADPFKAQMLAIVDHQAQRIEQLTAQLKQTPTLQSTTLSSPTTVPQEADQERRRYSERLVSFWSSANDGRSPRELAIEAFEDSVRDQAYRRQEQGLLSAESRHALFSLLQLVPGQPTVTSPLRCYRLALKVGDSASCPLAGCFVVKPADESPGPLLWVAPGHDWLSFADSSAFTAHFATPPGRALLTRALALSDRSVMQHPGVLQIGHADLQPRPGAALVDTIITQQARNLLYVMALPDASGNRAAMVDDALDVRLLLDPRQLQFTAGRWRQQAPFDFVEVWLPPPVVEPVPPPVTSGEETSSAASHAEHEHVPVAASTPSWRERTQAYDRRAERLRQLEPVLLNRVRQALQRYLCVWSREGLDVQDVRVRWLESQPAQLPDSEGEAIAVSETRQEFSMGLGAWLLECVSGRRAATLPVGAQVLAGTPPMVGSLPVGLIEHVLASLSAGFPEAYVADFEASRGEGQRQGDQPFQPDQYAVALREDAMRLYLDLASRQGWIDAAVAGQIREVLDQPVGTLRMAAGPAFTEACQVRLAFGQASALLSDALVLRPALVPEGPLVFWSSVSGWLTFSSPDHLQRGLQRMLRRRDRWLELLGELDGRRLSEHLDKTTGVPVQVRLQAIPGHAINALQHGVLERQLQDLRQLCLNARRCQFEAGVFSQLAAQCEIDASLTTLLDGLSLKVQTSLFEALLPPWLSSASITDLGRYYDLLKQYYVASDGGKDFLFGIESLHVYARRELTARLNVDFPGQGLNPNLITVTSRSFVSAFPPAGELPSGLPAATVVHSESLTDYAINRFATHQGAVLSVVSAEHPQIAQMMPPDYLRQLVRSLNVGAGYVAVLRQALTPGDARYEIRKRLFIEQLPAMLLAVALSQKLKGSLSEQAFALLSGVFEMPDGIAREPVNGIKAIFSPLQLVADEGVTPDAVTGLYVISPEPDNAGPVVLFAIHHAEFTFREYSSLTALEEDIRSNATLQALLLKRVEPEVHRRYDHGGFVEPHLPFSVEGFADTPFRAPGPVTLEIAEVKGNALQFLFKNTIKLLLELGVANSVTNQQEDQAGNIFLATLGFEQVLSLLPGKLAAMVTLWQSQMWLRASAVSASGQHWGEAFSEFTTALGVMVTAREQALAEQVDADLGSSGSGVATDEEEPSPTPSSWRNGVLDAEQKMRLQRLEAQGVALTDMRHDALLNLYVDKQDATTYAVVSGKVYRVRHIVEDGKWVIVGADGTSGPRLLLDTNQRWHLDLSLRLRGGGGAVTRIKEGKVDKSAKDILVIEARGMPEIRLLYRDRARRIGQAHLKAKRYLETCLDNLSPLQNGQPLDPRVSRIIGDFFGVSSPGQALQDATSGAARALFGAIMDASLSPFSSPRFVVGSTRPGHETVTAFVIKSDPKQRVYLTEQFFLSPTFAIKPDALAKGFAVDVHHRAANLIHELSHLVLDTHDIAYLEAMAPFPDVLLEDTAMNTTIKANVTRLHETRMSHRSNRDALFTLMDGGRRRDIEPEDGRGFELILRITGAHDLDDARDVFLNDAVVRSQLILRNADSVTLLMLQLGRENFVLPSP